MKRCPEIRVDTIRLCGGSRMGNERLLRFCQGSSLCLLAQEVLVEELHELGAAGIIHFPERWQERGSTSVEEAASQTDDFVEATNDGTPRFTGTQRHQRAGGEIEVEHFNGAQLAIGEFDVREVGSVESEEAVRGDVYKWALCPCLPEQRCGSCLVQHTGRSQLFGNDFCFLYRKGQTTTIGEAQYERVTQIRILCFDALSPLLADIQQCRRWQIGDIEAFN